MHNVEWAVTINLLVEDGITAYEFKLKGSQRDSPMVIIAGALALIPLVDTDMISSIHLYRLDLS